MIEDMRNVMVAEEDGDMQYIVFFEPSVFMIWKRDRRMVRFRREDEKTLPKNWVWV